MDELQCWEQKNHCIALFSNLMLVYDLWMWVEVIMCSDVLLL